ncbi:hypothetical protein F5B18DRAFT_650613 [Nemania serpens]|nr:hypothetical protein F5B18DRAFT_650613 [Nemania serpens]
MHPYFDRHPSPDNRWKDEMVAFFHPAYPDQNAPLLALTAVDVREDQTYGINFETARAACGIVAGNRWDQGAYFAEKSEREDGKTVWTRIGRPFDGVLQAGFEYYFVVDTPDNRYPVVPNFHHWRFPHDALPFPWALLFHPTPGDDEHGNDHENYATEAGGAGGPNPAQNRSRDMNCFKDTCLARVAPFSHRLWLERNSMEKYCGPHGGSKRTINKTNLSDLYDSLKAHFHRCRLLRPDPSTRLERRYESHPLLHLSAIIFESSHRYQGGLWRLPDVDIRREHLFARFAFNILSRDNYRFLSGDEKYTVRLFDIEKGEQYTAELHSHDIAEQSRILRPRRCTESVDPTREVEKFPEDPSGSSTEEVSEDEGRCYYRRRGRRRWRSPERYEHWPSRESSQQRQASARHARQTTQDAPTQQHASSMASLSISSTVSVSSFETPGAEPTVGRAADEIGSKRQYDEEEHIVTSRSPKRRRLT